MKTTDRTVEIDGHRWTRIDGDDPDELDVFRAADTHAVAFITTGRASNDYVRSDYFDAEMAKRKPKRETGWHLVETSGHERAYWWDADTERWLMRPGGPGMPFRANNDRVICRLVVEEGAK